MCFVCISALHASLENISIANIHNIIIRLILTKNINIYCISTILTDSIWPSHLYSPESVLMTLLMEKLGNSPIGVVEFPLYHENELTVGFASRNWHTNCSVAFSTRESMFMMFTVGESWIKKCVSDHIQYYGKGSPKCNMIQ
jgi:hypothetical protein